MDKIKKKVIVVSDFSMRGSGYLNIAIPLCTGLALNGHEIMAVGLGYKGEEHIFPFSIIPCNNYADAQAMVNNLHFQWNSDLCIVALDVTQQIRFQPVCEKLGMKQIAITALENPPLRLSWAVALSRLAKVFFISELGKQAGLKAGVPTADHLVVGMDTKSWRQRTGEEYTQGRAMLGIGEDVLTVLTVADNQERKNLAKGMEIISKVKKKGIKVRYILVTREHSEVGWGLRDLALHYGIAPDVMIFERGLSFKELYALYAISDAFLLTSKAEGLCLPVMEAMSVGIPVVATNTGSMPELLGEGRGFLMETAYPLPDDDMIDPWGNSIRVFPSSNSGTEVLVRINEHRNSLVQPEFARAYMETRTWENAIKQIEEALEVLNETA